ncbi:glycerol kinase [Ruminococcaceae bacterium YRB3002]|nr:glycerol kinase [Ruminococcaceae bacterium YRB3002]
MGRYILSIDQGTTSTKAFLLDRNGVLTSGTPVSITQIYPQPGYVEHDPSEIYFSVLKAIANVISENPFAVRDIEGIGITNQRETTIAFDRDTMESPYNAIVWQCRRTSEICRRSVITDHGQEICSKTGLKIDPYFSATKMMWLHENVPSSADCLLATVDGYLVYRLTGGRSFTSDYSNCSRTMLFDINRLDYDDDLLELFGIRRECLAKPMPSCGEYGEISLNRESLSEYDLTNNEIELLLTLNGVHITGVAGDQPAALFGQNAVNKGDCKTTYGTGCFTLMNLGTSPVFSRNGLLTSAAWSIGGTTYYALEGSVFQGGSIISWLKDEMKMIDKPSDCDAVCRSIDSTEGVYLVPAFTGLGAPYWNADVRGVLTGLTRGSGRAQIVRASVESIAYQVTELVNLMMEDTGISAKQMKVDGGVCACDFLMQFQSDLLGIRITRARSDEMTAMGAGLLAGLTCGFFSSVEELEGLYQASTSYDPDMTAYEVSTKMNGYKDAVRTALAT